MPAAAAARPQVTVTPSLPLRDMLTDGQRQALEGFHHTGFAILPDAITGQRLAMLRRLCAEMVAEVDEQIDAGGGDLVRPLTHKDERYFVDFTIGHKPEIRDLIDSDIMRSVCREVLALSPHGGTVYHHKQQFVVKCPSAEMEFAWHQGTCGMFSTCYHPTLLTIHLHQTPRICGGRRTHRGSRAG